jgi:hypothetical protein
VHRAVTVPICCAYSCCHCASAALDSGASTGFVHDGCSPGHQADCGTLLPHAGSGVTHEGGDVGQRGAGVEDPRHAGIQQHLLVIVGHDAARR